MNKLFRYEADLVGAFRHNYLSKRNTLIIDEMKIRWGNIDLVEISNVSLPFTEKQCKVLSKPSCAKIFMRLKNKRLLSKQKLFVGMGMSESTFNKALYELTKEDLIIREGQNYRRNVEFVFPKVVITGYEAKLTDYNKALFQAKMNKELVDYSYMVFPMDIAENILQKHGEVVEASNLGLIGVAGDRAKVYIRPKRNENMKPYIRLMNLVISNEVYMKEAAV